MLQRPPIIDMRADGSFRAPQQVNVLFTTKVALGALAVALLGGALTVAALAIWLVSLILPAVIIAGGVAYVAWKLRGWQLGRGPTNGHIRRF